MKRGGPDLRPVCAGSGQVTEFLDGVMWLPCPECGKRVRISPDAHAIVRHRVGYSTAESARRNGQRSEPA